VSRLACLVLLGVALTACSRTQDPDHGADRSTAPLAVQAPPATIQEVGLAGDELVAYVGANAKKLVESWRPLAFNGELKPYDPEDWNFAFNRLVDDACRSNAVWSATAAFKDERMGQIPTAVSTPDGPVLYERVWRKYSDEDREIYVGVRTSDRACGAFDLASGTLKVSGDGDVVAALVAAFAIRKVDREADQRTLTSQTRYAAIENISALLPAVSNATPTQTEASVKAVRRAYCHRSNAAVFCSATVGIRQRQNHLECIEHLVVSAP